ncbi:hypothetical protein AMECASPLE_008673 [Ameca splendens]|uniref:Uncharacterized protein n=1 Tax=Ameca splendens TaxID=208324 RepID=A0ABV0YZD7_9TELE
MRELETWNRFVHLAFMIAGEVCHKSLTFSKVKRNMEQLGNLGLWRWLHSVRASRHLLWRVDKHPADEKTLTFHHHFNYCCYGSPQSDKPKSTAILNGLNLCYNHKTFLSSFFCANQV